MSRLIAIVAAAAIVGCLAGCSTLLRPPQVGTPPLALENPEAEARYNQVLERWTQRHEIYEKLDTRVFFAATFEAMPFRRARVARNAVFQALPESEIEAALVAEQQAHSESLVFMLGMYVSRRQFDDLARPDGMWRIALVSEAGEARPISIERIARPDAALQAFYPYLDKFWVGYRLRFPRQFDNGARVLPEQAGRFTLLLASAVGKAELVFELDAPQPGSASVWP